MKIPHLVNTVLDWWSRTVWWPAVHNPGLTVSVATGAAAFAALSVLPPLVWPLVFFSAGSLLGWFCHSPALWQLRDLLQTARFESARLRADNTTLMRGRAPADAEDTVYLPQIREGR